jgi:4-carboxymuconolactone decarboxylase
MSDSPSDRRERGLAKFNEVYGGKLPAPPPGAMDFFDLMLEQTFAEVWTREALPMRDRRLLIMGVIAALGERDTFKIQAKAALEKGELTPEQLREIVIMLAHYAGYPRAAGLVGVVEQTIAEAAKG